MAETKHKVVLHIGNYKTGTTSLQRFLRTNEALLAEHGYRFPYGWLRRDQHHELSVGLMRPDRLSTPRVRSGKDEWRSEAFRRLLVDQVLDDLDRHRDVTTILSGESTAMLRYDDELAALRSVVGDALVVVYWREPVAWLASMSDQLVKNGMGLSVDPDAFNYMRPDSWQVDYEERTGAWRRHFRTVRSLTYEHHVRRDGSIIPSFLRQVGVPVPLTLPRYQENRRGAVEDIAPGNRFENGLPFGMTPAPVGQRS